MKTRELIKQAAIWIILFGITYYFLYEAAMKL